MYIIIYDHIRYCTMACRFFNFPRIPLLCSIWSWPLCGDLGSGCWPQRNEISVHMPGIQSIPSEDLGHKRKTEPLGTLGRLDGLRDHAWSVPSMNSIFPRLSQALAALAPRRVASLGLCIAQIDQHWLLLSKSFDGSKNQTSWMPSNILGVDAVAFEPQKYVVKVVDGKL